MGQLCFLSHLVVGHLVVVKVAGGCEPLSTNATLVRLFSAVNSPATEPHQVESFLRIDPDPPVCIEAGARGEAFVANIADVRLLPGVGSHVPLQQAGPVKSLSTDGAGKHGLLPGPPGEKQKWSDYD